MDQNDFFVLGKIMKTSGYKGGLVFFFDVDDPQAYSKLEAVFIDLGGEPVPYAIRKLKQKSLNTFYAELEEVDTEQQAEALAGYDLLLPASLLEPLEGNSFYYHEIIGFQAIDQEKGKLGQITDVLDQSAQHCFRIDYQGKELLVPVVDQFIVEVDRQNRTIVLNLPDGLTEL
ncbi:MAG: ribosome maturation factor RimM [Bacteroidales bacterium]